jgi:hypothetical protein
MANPEWMEIFRSWEPVKLAAYVAELEKQISVFATQNVGQKGYTKDLGELRGQLSAAVQIQTERGLPPNQSVGVTDFSRASNVPLPSRWGLGGEEYF